MALTRGYPGGHQHNIFSGNRKDIPATFFLFPFPFFTTPGNRSNTAESFVFSLLVKTRKEEVPIPGQEGSRTKYCPG